MKRDDLYKLNVGDLIVMRTSDGCLIDAKVIDVCDKHGFREVAIRYCTGRFYYTCYLSKYVADYVFRKFAIEPKGDISFRLEDLEF